MFFLNCERDDKIMIGDDIVLTVTQVRRGSVRVGIDAPRDVLISRDELLYRGPKVSKTNRQKPI